MLEEKNITELEVVDDFGTVKVDELTTINTERTAAAPVEEMPAEVVEASMSERDRQLKNRPGMRSPEEKERLADPAATTGATPLNSSAPAANSASVPATPTRPLAPVSSSPTSTTVTAPAKPASSDN